ncbi:MAG TPA: peptidoglycan-binding domain-containing protein [Candidatus Paceibacterota bacterium]|nr:peptidoglycan-binding domain-containing protein [Candidatus Paceibacterota bacterium]
MQNFHRNQIFIFVLLVGAFFFSSLAAAHAAPLNFATAENISLSSPSTTLTIATGSVADALSVNATSVLVMMSSSTGGTFTLVSPSYDLSVATSSGGGTATVSCTNGIESAALSQTTGSTVYTLTPTTTNCSSASAPIITNVTSGLFVDVPDGATTTVSTGTASLEAEIASLEAELQALIAEQNGASATNTRVIFTVFHFTRDLERGDRGVDVKALQELLIKEHIGPAAKALGEYGPTDYFGDYTFDALKEFQKHAGIVPDSGYFGPLTRAYVATL